MSKTLKRLAGTSTEKSSDENAKSSSGSVKLTFDKIKLDELFGSLDLCNAVQQALRDEAADIAYDAKMRQPYVTVRECEQYMEDRESGIRMKIPNAAGAIPMRKNAAGVWEQKKRGKKTD